MKPIRLFGALAPLAAVLIGCAHGPPVTPPPPPPPPPPPTACTPDNSGSSAIVDTVSDRSGGSGPLSLKLGQGIAKGLCVEGASGDIHTFHALTDVGALYVTIDPSLAGKAVWPSNVTDAVQIQGPGDIWTPWPNATYDPGGVLAFSVPAPAAPPSGPAVYHYRLQYTDPGGPPGNLHTVEPMVVNH
jgi:hypothetical protein